MSNATQFIYLLFLFHFKTRINAFCIKTADFMALLRKINHHNARQGQAQTQ